MTPETKLWYTFTLREIESHLDEMRRSYLDTEEVHRELLARIRGQLGEISHREYSQAPEAESWKRFARPMG